MDYELAKQLKDAGFPQTTKMYFCEDLGEPTYSPDCGAYPGSRCGKHLAMPNLDELIAVCGASFHTLGRSDAKWWAAEFKEPFAQTFPSRCDGSSPEEAVARLWLALHVYGDATARDTLK